jgi:hypothetical protein
MREECISPLCLVELILSVILLKMCERGKTPEFLVYDYGRLGECEVSPGMRKRPDFLY